MNKSSNLFEKLIESCAGEAPLKTAVVHPVRGDDLEVVFEAAQRKVIEPVLVGPRRKIEEAANQANVDLSRWEIVDVEHSHAAAEISANMAVNGEVGSLLKGGLHTDELLHAVLKNKPLLTGRRISQAYLMDVPTYHKPLIVTDAAINISPDLDVKVDICQNAINFWRALFGTERKPKVAFLAAVETVNSKMQATIDAACLCKMSDREQITGGILDGPLAFDNAISKEAALSKGITSEVAGDPDILIPPNLESCNILAKELTFLANAQAAAIVLGARIPIILTSRADSIVTRVMSCAIAAKVDRARKAGVFK